MIVILKDNTAASTIVNIVTCLVVVNFVPQLVPLMANPVIYKF